MYMVLRTSVGPNPQIKFICFQQSQSLWYIAPLIHLRGLNFSVFIIQPMNPLSDSDPLSALSVYPVRQVIGSPVLQSPKFRYRFIYFPVIFHFATLKILFSLSITTDIAAYGARSLLADVIQPEDTKKLCSCLVLVSEFAQIGAGI